MDLIEQIKVDLRGAAITRVKEVADAAGVSFFTLRKIVYGTTLNPRYDTVERLRKYYEPAQRRSGEKIA